MQSADSPRPRSSTHPSSSHPLQKENKTNSTNNHRDEETINARADTAVVPLMVAFLQTLQRCHLCGVCFQNRFQMYRGKFPTCQRCRPAKLEPIIVIRRTTAANPSNIPKFTQYVLPLNWVSAADATRLFALHNQTLEHTIKPEEWQFVNRMLLLASPKRYDLVTQFVVRRVDITLD